jgi:transcriptional regulator with XRE-family HTH domain
MTAQMIKHRADGLEVQRRRLALGYSRERLGAAADGISSATVRRIECGLVRPHPSTRAAIARALGCEIRDIFPTTNERPDPGPDQGAHKLTGVDGRYGTVQRPSAT